MNDEGSACHVCPLVHTHEVSSCYIFFSIKHIVLTIHNRSFRCVSNLSASAKQKASFRLIKKESIIAHL